MSADVDKEESDLYKQTFEAFSRDVVRTRIINGKEIIYMSKLLTIFKKMVLQIENLDATNFRSIQLKRRLQNKFPQLVFHRPAKQVKSDMVFVEDTSHVEKIQSSTSDTTETESTESTSSDSSAGVRKPQDFDQDSLHCLYTSAMKLRAEFVECIGYEGPWPPLDCDLTIAKAKSMIPIKLYNILAWTIGASDEPTLDSYVEIEESVELKLLSILQDIISLQSKGRKHTPKSLALGLTIRHLTGSQKVINLLHGLGHCASHKTIIRYDTSLAQLQLSKGPVYIPTGFQSDVNTLLVWDNIDFSEETISGHGTTHHTNGIAIQCTTPCVEEVTDTQRIPLPKVPSTELHTATTITAYHPKRRTGPPVATINKELIQKNNYSKFHLRQHKIDLAFLLIKHFNSSDNLYPGWTGFNTELASTDDLQKSEIAYLPVIEASPTEMNTVNTILCRSIEFADKLNLRSITVVFDLTIYAKAQEIRWTDENFLKRLVIRLGEFHTSMSFLSVIGKRFRDAGLHDILIEAEIVAGGSINGVLDGKHYNRCMNAHKLVLEALTRLKLKAFFESLTEEIRAKLIRFMEYMADSYPSQLFKDLCASDEFSEIITLITDYDQKNIQSSSTYALWISYLGMVETLLSFIRATRESNWNLHLASIRSMLPWFFAYDKTHYARYLPAYWIEMIQLATTHPEVFQSFHEGQWTVQRQTKYGFSAIACDQTIEQTCNRDAKTSKGVIGFTLNRNAVRRWILSQSQRASINHQCEKFAGLSVKTRTRKDLDASRKRREEEAIIRIMDCVDQMINPFTYNKQELVSISSGVVATDSVCTDMLSAGDHGEAALMSFIEDRLTSDKNAFHEPLKQTKLKTFSYQNKIKTKTTFGKEISLQSDRKLFSRMLIIGQNRKIDLKEIMKYSLGPVSYSLASSNGSLAKTNKAALLNLIERKSKNCLEDGLPEDSALIVDGMALIQSLPKQLPETFGEVADLILSILISQANFRKIKRVDFVTDQYPPISIKNAERSRRSTKGTQLRQIYSKDQKIPQQWPAFLTNGKNKEGLVDFLYKHWCNIKPAKLCDVELFLTHGNSCSKFNNENGELKVINVSELYSDHEEADTRIILHANHASVNMFTNIVIKSPDTDVAIILLSFTEHILANLFFYTGTKTKSRIINLQTIFDSLGRDTSLALVGLHTFTGCDSTSCFHGKGKIKPFDIMVKNQKYLRAFIKLGSSFNIDELTVNTLEEFVCELYGHSGTNVDDARYKLFCLKTSTEQNLPPTRDALVLHIKRANYQAAVHRHAVNSMIKPPLPSEHGWNLDNNDISINWMTLDPAPENLLKYVHCKCTTKCDSKRCSCRHADLSCTDLCGCKDCNNSVQTSTEIEIDVIDDDDVDNDDDTFD